MTAAPVYLTTGEPYIDEPESCPACGGDGWYIGHEDECYEGDGCVCSGIQVECECQRDTSIRESEVQF